MTSIHILGVGITICEKDVLPADRLFSKIMQLYDEVRPISDSGLMSVINDKAGRAHSLNLFKDESTFQHSIRAVNRILHEMSYEGKSLYGICEFDINNDYYDIERKK